MAAFLFRLAWNGFVWVAKKAVQNPTTAGKVGTAILAYDTLVPDGTASEVWNWWQHNKTRDEIEELAIKMEVIKIMTQQRNFVPYTLLTGQLNETVDSGNVLKTYVTKASHNVSSQLMAVKKGITDKLGTSVSDTFDVLSAGVITVYVRNAGMLNNGRVIPIISMAGDIDALIPCVHQAMVDLELTDLDLTDPFRTALREALYGLHHVYFHVGIRTIRGDIKKTSDLKGWVIDTEYEDALQYYHKNLANLAVFIDDKYDALFDLAAVSSYLPDPTASECAGEYEKYRSEVTKMAVTIPTAASMSPTIDIKQDTNVFNPGQSVGPPQGKNVADLPQRMMENQQNKYVQSGQVISPTSGNPHTEESRGQATLDDLIELSAQLQAVAELWGISMEEASQMVKIINKFQERDDKVFDDIISLRRRLR